MGLREWSIPLVAAGGLFTAAELGGCAKSEAPSNASSQATYVDASASQTDAGEVDASKQDASMTPSDGDGKTCDAISKEIIGKCTQLEQIGKIKTAHAKSCEGAAAQFKRGLPKLEVCSGLLGRAKKCGPSTIDPGWKTIFDSTKGLATQVLDLAREKRGEYIKKCGGTKEYPKNVGILQAADLGGNL